MRVWNFSAGPAALPEPVLREAADQMLDWRGSGMGVMEMSHRGPEFMSIHAEAQADLRRLLGVPDGYATLFLQGGAIAENAIVPMNLLRGHASADYLVTGQWSKKSAEEARRYADVNVVADARDAFGGFTGVPDQASWRCSKDAAYLHLCTNETIDGVELFDPVVRAGLDAADAVARAGAGAVPEGVPVVADVSSHLLSRPMDVSRFGCLYGGAQKNIGPAGLTIVVVREDLIGQAHPHCPTAFDWKVVADADSMYNTPPTWAIYVAGLVFKWIDAQGGIAAIEAANVAKAALLYDAIDASGLYVNRVRRENRSRMNVPFHLREPALEKAFLDGAAERGLVQLKGHRSVGGLRASIYNAMPVEGVRALVDWMREFEKTRG